jgi:hypothetical protein
MDAVRSVCGAAGAIPNSRRVGRRGARLSPYPCAGVDPPQPALKKPSHLLARRTAPTFELHLPVPWHHSIALVIPLSHG